MRYVESEFNQPKAEMCEHVEALGVMPTLEVYSSVEEGLAAATHENLTMLRSEHPMEFGGPSGLGNSVVIGERRAVVSQDQRGGFFGHYLNLLIDGTVDANNPFFSAAYGGDAIDYALALGIDHDKFIARASFSAWRYQEGVNVTIFGDTSREGHYWITGSQQAPDGVYSYLYGALYDADGQVVLDDDRSPNNSSIHASSLGERSIVQRGIQHYRDLSSGALPHIAPDTIPKVELVLTPDANFKFAQIDPGQDLDLSSPSLNPADFPEAEGWIRSKLVRGSTHGDILRRAAILDYLVIDLSQLDEPMPMLIHPDYREGASLANTELIPRFYHEALTNRDVAIQSMAPGRLFNDLAGNGHTTTSAWHGSQLSMSVSVAALRNQSAIQPEYTEPSDMYESDEAYERTAVGWAQTVFASDIEVVSDGYDGYARIPPNAEGYKINMTDPYTWPITS